MKDTTPGRAVQRCIDAATDFENLAQLQTGEARTKTLESARQARLIAIAIEGEQAAVMEAQQAAMMAGIRLSQLVESTEKYA